MVAHESMDVEVQPPHIVRHARAASVLIPGAVDGDALAQRLALGNGAVDQPADDVDAIALRLRLERLLRVGREPNDFFGLPKRRGRLLQERHARIPISEVLRRRQARRRRELEAR